MKPRKNPYAEILREIEEGLWEQDLRVNEGIAEPYEYTDEAFAACIKIFSSALMWKLWENKGERGLEEMENRAESLGTDIRRLVQEYCRIDTHELWKNPERK